MQLHELKITLKKPNKKRVGRGGKRGTTSGKGQKGQKARAGHRIRPAERDLLQRLPKLRGVKNKTFHNGVLIIQTDELEKIFGEKPVSKKTLLESQLIKQISDKVKILDRGEAKRAFQIDGIPISKNAKMKIEKAGGSIK